MLARSRSRSRAGVFEEVLTLPVAVPGLATALALILVYGEIRRSFRQSFRLVILVGPHRLHVAVHGAHGRRRVPRATAA